MGIGIGFFMFPVLGPDPASVFIEGLGSQLGLNYGQSSLIVNGVVALVIFFIDRRFVHIASVTMLFTGGFVADITSGLLGTVVVGIESAPIPFRFLFTIAGGLLLSIGVVIYTDQDLGAAAIDGMAELATFRTKQDYSKIKRLVDLVMLVIGYFLGGTVGFGTVYLAFTTGPTISFLRKKFIYN